MTCSWCEERFERFLDGLLTYGEHARLIAHVDRCNACSGLLEELRVVDALLLAPRAVELPPDFTSATMADVRSIPVSQARCAPVAALLVAYTVAAWSLAGATLLIAPDAVWSAYHSAVAVAGTVFAAFAGLGHTFALLGGSVIVADGIVLVAAAVALRALRPRIAERLRW